ncbi:hypothetical protein F5X99DRAFT_170213 [Biscogniauxia marginata]|nr:hypothetical protein F5X99DRAFT_170213 [Biscogniauxia marginata]
MYSPRLVHLLMVALSISSAAQAALVDAQLLARQDLLPGLDDATTSSDPDTTTAAAPTTTTQSDPTTATTEDTTAPTTTVETTDSPTTTTEDNTTPTTAPTDATTTRTTGPTTSPTTGGQTSPTTTDGPTSTSASGGSETTSGGDGTTEASESTTLQPSTSTRTVVFTYTGENGQESVSSTASEVVTTPSLAGSSDNNSPSGPDQGTRNTIIGVCVGVGGAIVLAVGGLLFWRLRNKKRNSEESEELVSYGNGFGGPGTAEKSEISGPASSRSPFQSTLESYHAPTQTNAASNF